MTTTGPARALATAGTIVGFLAAVVAANLIVNHYGPSSTPYVAFFLIGCALILRDRFADIVGPRRAVAQAALIAAGALLTWLANRDAQAIVLASVVAFAASETVEQTAYYLIRRRPWLERAPLSALAGAAIDSALFITIAFGFDLAIAAAQFFAKVAGAYLWAWLLQTRADRALLPRDA